MAIFSIFSKSLACFFFLLLCIHYFLLCIYISIYLYLYLYLSIYIYIEMQVQSSGDSFSLQFKVTSPALQNALPFSIPSQHMKFLCPHISLLFKFALLQLMCISIYFYTLCTYTLFSFLFLKNSCSHPFYFLKRNHTFHC